MLCLTYSDLILHLRYKKQKQKIMKNEMTKIQKAFYIMEAMKFLGVEPENYSVLLKQAGSQDALLAFLEAQLTNETKNS